MTDNQDAIILHLIQENDPLPLECDGLTRVLHTLLARAGISHTVFIGGVVHHPTHVGQDPHLWIDLDDGRRLDCRARMWLGDHPDVPHGLFEPAQFPAVQYEGIVTPMPILSDPLLDILRRPIPPEIIAYLQNKKDAE